MHVFYYIVNKNVCDISNFLSNTYQRIMLCSLCFYLLQHDEVPVQ